MKTISSAPFVAAALLAALVSSQAAAQEKELKPLPIALPTVAAVSPTDKSKLPAKEERATVAEICLQGNDAWFQRQMELTDGDTAAGQYSIRRCYRVLQIDGTGK